MKINSLDLHNFLCFKRQAFGFKRLNIIAGPNGSGKSSIKDAIQFALTGKIARNPIHYGTNQARVILETDKFFVERTQSKNQKLSLSLEGNEVAGTLTVKQARLMAYLNTSERVIEAVLNTHLFLRLNDDDRKKLVFDAMDIAITREALVRWLEERNGDIDWEGILTQLQEKEDFDLNDVKANRKLATEMRRQLKREFSSLSAQLDAIVDVPDNLVEQIKKSKVKLEKLQKDLNALYERKGAAGKESMKEIDEKIQQLQQEKEKVITELSKINQQKAVVQRDMEMLQDELNRMQKLGKVCVLSDEIPCPMKKEQVKAVVGGKEKQIAKLEKELKALQKQAAPLNEKRARLEVQIQELVRQRADARWEDPEVEKQIRELEFRIQKGKSYVENLLTQEKDLQKKEMLEEQLAELQVKINVWDTLEKAYGERGIRAELLREKLDGMRTRANQLARLLGIGTIDFVTQDGSKEVFRVTVNGNDVSQYSYGEQHAISLILQDAMAWMSGLRVLVLDEANVFVGELKQNMNAVFMRLMEDYDTVFVLKADDEPMDETPPLDDVQYIWLGATQEVAA